MTGNSLQPRRILSARRIALLATTIAGIGAAAMLLSPNVVSPFAPAAQAQNLSEKVQQLPQKPVGFADIVEKVKPAVISVRVKIDQPAEFEQQRRQSPFPAGLAVRKILPAVRYAQHAERP